MRQLTIRIIRILLILKFRTQSNNTISYFSCSIDRFYVTVLWFTIL